MPWKQQQQQQINSWEAGGRYRKSFCNILDVTICIFIISCAAFVLGMIPDGPQNSFSHHVPLCFYPTAQHFSQWWNMATIQYTIRSNGIYRNICNRKMDPFTECSSMFCRFESNPLCSRMIVKLSAIMNASQSNGFDEFELLRAHTKLSN